MWLLPYCHYCVFTYAATYLNYLIITDYYVRVEFTNNTLNVYNHNNCGLMSYVLTTKCTLVNMYVARKVQQRLLLNICNKTHCDGCVTRSNQQFYGYILFLNFRLFWSFGFPSTRQKALTVTESTFFFNVRGLVPVLE